MQRCNAWTHSEEAKKLAIQSMDTVVIKVLQRQLEVLQWQMFQSLLSDADQVIFSFDSKKEPYRVKVPVSDKIRLPFAGAISTENPKGALVFCKIFGVDFYILPKDAKDSNPASVSSSAAGCDVLVAEGSAKTMAKPHDAFFQHRAEKMKFLLLAPPGPSTGTGAGVDVGRAMSLEFKLVNSSNALESESGLQKLAERREAEGWFSCYLVSLDWIGQSWSPWSGRLIDRLIRLIVDCPSSACHAAMHSASAPPRRIICQSVSRR